ncbi:MAG: NADPH-dependent aldehyde reductase Ahr [Alphaproteobacteria bacterium]
MTDIKAYAASKPKGELTPYTYSPGPLPHDQVEIDVTACGICHSDISMIDNEWGASQYPLVPGHEAVGKITALGENVSHLKIGQTVGVGWTAESCLTCGQCMSGHHQRCGTGKPTIRGRHGGFADRMRVQAVWAIPLPDNMDARSAGPLFCGGITVFAPFMDYDIKPTDRVGVIGIGGLGHLAIQFAKAWGCEVTAFTGSMDKEDELKTLGAHKVINNRDDDLLKSLRGQYDMILSTVNVNLAWHRYVAALAPQGQLIHVGMVTEPMAVSGGSLVPGQKKIGGSDTGSPAMVAKMLEFCTRHDIKPMTEYFKFDQVNDAIAHLKSGKARYRIVLEH